MKSEWLELRLNCDEERDIETFINLEDVLMLQNHFVRGWEIVPNTNDSNLINPFYTVFRDGISGDKKEKCIEIYDNKKQELKKLLKQSGIL